MPKLSVESRDRWLLWLSWMRPGFSLFRNGSPTSGNDRDQSLHRKPEVVRTSRKCCTGDRTNSSSVSNLRFNCCVAHFVQRVLGYPSNSQFSSPQFGRLKGWYNQYNAHMFCLDLKIVLIFVLLSCSHVLILSSSRTVPERSTSILQYTLRQRLMLLLPEAALCCRMSNVSLNYRRNAATVIR